MGRKKNKKAKQSKKKRQPPEVKRTRHSLIQRRTLNVPEIQNLVTDNGRGGRSQNTDNMTEDKLLQHYSKMLDVESPFGYNSPQVQDQPGSAAKNLARQRRLTKPQPQPKSKKMGTPSGASFDRRLSFGGRRKSKRRRKKKRRRTIRKKRKKKN
mgnify:CR=1 FL=1